MVEESADGQGIKDPNTGHMPSGSLETLYLDDGYLYILPGNINTHRG